MRVTPETQRILRARAHALARPPQHAVATDASIDVVEFHLAQERYAVETRYVTEVYPLNDLTPFPCTPSFVLGVVNVRGRITTVIDVKKFFDLPDKGLTDLHRIILVRDNDFELGLLADIVIGVRSLAKETLQSALPAFTAIRPEYVKGVTAERLVVLNTGRILADPKIVVHEEVGD